MGCQSVEKLGLDSQLMLLIPFSVERLGFEIYQSINSAKLERVLNNTLQDSLEVEIIGLWFHFIKVHVSGDPGDAGLHFLAQVEGVVTSSIPPPAIVIGAATNGAGGAGTKAFVGVMVDLNLSRFLPGGGGTVAPAPAAKAAANSSSESSTSSSESSSSSELLLCDGNSKCIVASSLPALVVGW
eukprot:CAMPEP_0201216266 /NCGR_PEP_ID=MMETSP0851-20130426/189422_1 /ASSEMBLY_ACC=CAM_ASM_000631 /TAXON_ID=183588 /ORGANISM="Pseudo-nitzschia fraudulenta, Strain WWA7" /LENGTH=183 /DNA_ID=CAMNT_0047505815 /DNA_START=464 /DNA_END=1013 /DNA_ORIENTATION=-